MTIACRWPALLADALKQAREEGIPIPYRRLVSGHRQHRLGILVDKRAEKSGLRPCGYR